LPLRDLRKITGEQIRNLTGYQAYIRQRIAGGYLIDPVCAFVCLAVSRISVKVIRCYDWAYQ